MKLKKKLLSFLLVFASLISFADTAYAEESVWPKDPEIFSESAVLMEASTGTILYEKNATETRFPASITKILTVLLSIENGKMDDNITFSDASVRKTEGTRIGFDVGETISVESCIYAVMLGSDNQCAFALAEYIGGTYEKFVEMMNERVKKIGCVNTHFNNPHGLPDDNHYTCAYDMALITQEAMKNASFRKVFSTKQYQVPATNKTDARLINNHHQMVLDRDYNYHFDGITGGKTGYTSLALNTLVTTATQNNMDLICIVMKTSSTHYSDTRNLLNYGFQNFSLVNISENEKTYNQDAEDFLQVGRNLIGNNDFSLHLSEDADIVLPNGVSFSSAEVTCNYDNLEADCIARLTYHLGKHEIGSADISIKTNKKEATIFNPSNESEDEKKAHHVIKVNLGKILLILLAIVAGLAIIILLIRYRKPLGITRIVRKMKRLKKPKYPSQYRKYKFK